MNSATEINIAAYSPVPELQVTDIAQYKEVIENHVVKHGVKWVIKNTARNDITDQDLDGTRGSNENDLFFSLASLKTLRWHFFRYNRSRVARLYLFRFVAFPLALQHDNKLWLFPGQFNIY
ncbi:hypothetical protein BCV71DRAFT_237039 [Rhizopus microsporus]|uniref:Uncharacterized protein n=1 Tax=Rhizopus microsporus TaxID=58291 RepID=A0A1X0RVI3_RHIZD|nr:hypothetical protein BCV71DRAFT_237039 [Rhizopus microsporus]